ncbi:Uncharacterised protein [Mycobacteroides abscessus subsp. massiliense]|nr:Uncharacterised protein [Mycobacteroides abscessus subsp. massiliense]
MGVAKTPGDHPFRRPGEQQGGGMSVTEPMRRPPGRPDAPPTQRGHFSRTVVFRNAANNGGRATFTSSGDVSGPVGAAVFPEGAVRLPPHRTLLDASGRTKSTLQGKHPVSR